MAERQMRPSATFEWSPLHRDAERPDWADMPDADREERVAACHEHLRAVDVLFGDLPGGKA